MHAGGDGKIVTFIEKGEKKQFPLFFPPVFFSLLVINATCRDRTLLSEFTRLYESPSFTSESLRVRTISAGIRDEKEREREGKKERQRRWRYFHETTPLGDGDDDEKRSKSAGRYVNSLRRSADRAHTYATAEPVFPPCSPPRASSIDSLGGLSINSRIVSVETREERVKFTLGNDEDDGDTRRALMHRVGSVERVSVIKNGESHMVPE